MTEHHLSRRTAIALVAAAIGVPALAPKWAAAQDATPVADAGGDAGWVAIRTYRLKPGTDRDAMIADTVEGLLPVMTALDGFVSFYVLRPDDLVWAAVTVWRDKAASDAGVVPIRAWIQATVADSLEGPPESFEGAVELVDLVDAGEDAAGDWVTIRSWPLTEDADRTAMLAATEAGYLPLLRSLEGFVAFFVVRPDDRTWTGIAAWRDEAAAAAALPPIREWVAENVADSLAGEPDGVEGSVDLAAFAPRVVATPTP